VNRSARIGLSGRSQSCRRTTRGQSHAVRTWSYLAATRCSGSSTSRGERNASRDEPDRGRELGRIRVAGQPELAPTRTDIPLDPYVLDEFGVASPADPTDGLTGGPPFSGLWPGPILPSRANVAGLSIWGDDLHPWRCPSGLRVRLPESLRSEQSPSRAVTRFPRHPDARALPARPSRGSGGRERDEATDDGPVEEMHDDHHDGRAVPVVEKQKPGWLQQRADVCRAEGRRHARMDER
jgi:hypothetical protein